MNISFNKSWSVGALLKGILASAFLFSAAAQAQVTVNCADGTDNNCVASFTGGLWNDEGLGQCLFVLPTAETREFEFPLGPDVNTTTNHVCIGGLADTNLTTNDDVGLRILRGTGADEAGAFSWTYGNTYPASLASAQFIPDSCGVTDFDATNPNRRNGTFDNGDKFGTNSSRDVIEPMSAELTLDTDVTGDATLSFYFMNGSEECRNLDWSLKVGGVEVKTGNIANFKDGKYLQFTLTGLQGGETIRLDVVNPHQPGGGTPTGCPIDLIPGVNSVISGVFVEGTSVCAPAKAALGDRVWIDTNRDGQQDCVDGGAGDPNNPADGIIGNAGDSGPECGEGVPNVRVLLRDSVDGTCGNGNDAPIRSTLTDANGFYGFSDLDTDVGYCVAWRKPTTGPAAGYECTLPNVGNDETDSDGQETSWGVCYTKGTAISLDPGETDLTWDLGLVPPPTASLGDRVWEDLDNDGVQDCEDGGADDPNNPANGIVGDAGDSGPECDAGIPDVPVKLLFGDCTTPQGSETDTGPDGFYLFDNLVPGDYCVAFGKPPAEFCNTDGFELGDPQFTTQGAGSDDDVDSDADPDTGITDSINLPGGADLSVDAGVYCPAKIGDRVWLDDDRDGLQGDLEEEISGITVELYECTNGQPIVDPDKFVDFRVTDADLDNDDMNYMFGAEDNFDLEPGTYFVRFRKDGYEFTDANVGDDDTIDSDCAGGTTSCTTVGSRGIDLTQDCGLVVPPPDCNLLLDKECRVETPPPPTFDKCDGKLQEFTLTATTALTGIALGDPGNGTGVSTKEVAAGGELTVFGPFSNNDVKITFNGGQFGQSVFHTSCSDSEFNSPDDCGKPAGDGKDTNDGFDNIWTLAGFVDNSGRVLDCDGGADGEFSQECSFEKQPLPTCDNGEKPDTLTWRYDGGAGGDGDCAGSTFDPLSPNAIVNEDGKLHQDFECSGAVNPLLQIIAVDDGGNAYTVNPGDTFTTKRDKIDKIMLTDSAGSVQNLKFHDSCSQPLEAQATAGALTLVGLDNRTGGVDVTYRYTVTNNGDPLTVTVTDDKLGYIGGPVALGTSGSAMFDSEPVTLFGTTTNKATASSDLCPAVTDTVTVTATEPTCKVSIMFEKVEDKKIKWKLSNSSSVDATIDTLTISWPGTRYLKKVKFDGNDILKDVALSSPATITSWLKEVKDRTLKAGDSGKNLEIEFTGDFPLKKEQPASDFDLTVNFEEGCSVTF